MTRTTTTPAEARAQAFALVAHADEVQTLEAYREAELATRRAERRTMNDATLARLVCEGERMMREGDAVAGVIR